MLITLLIFLIILLVLVLSHEAGHFFAARFFGIKVEEFGFGIPPRIFGIKKGDTLYSLNWLPFGGFVKIFGEEGASESDSAQASPPFDSFAFKPAWIRSSVLAAGICANFVTAFLVLSVVSSLGMPVALSDQEAIASRAAGGDPKVTILETAPGSPAMSANLQSGDQIQKISIGEESFAPQTIENVQKFVDKHKGEEILLDILRGKQEISARVSARQNPPAGEGPLGVALTMVEVKKTPFYLAPVEGARLTWNITRLTLSGFWELLKTVFKGEAIGVAVAGPVGIFNLTSAAKNLGLNTLLMFIAILSINLAIINILPFPGLDGGRLAFVAAEKIRGRKISDRVSSIVHGAGLAVLIALMLLITYHDIIRQF